MQPKGHPLIGFILYKIMLKKFFTLNVNCIFHSKLWGQQCLGGLKFLSVYYPKQKEKNKLK